MIKPIYLLSIYLKSKHLINSLLGVVLLFFLCLDANAQRKDIHSLLKTLQITKQDTERVNIYYSLSRLYWNKNTDSALFYANKSMNLAKNIRFEKGIALAYLTKGVIMVSKGRLPEALEYHIQCLKLSEKLGLTGLSGNGYNNIGIVYEQMEEYEKALLYFRKAYQIALKQHDPTEFVTFGLLVNIGEVFKKQNLSDSAIVYNQKALKIAENVKDTMSISIALYNIGENNITIKHYQKANEYLLKALALSNKLNDQEGITYCNTAFALLYYQKQAYQRSLLYAKLAFEQNSKLDIYEINQQLYNVLYLTHQKLGHYKEALYYRNLEVSLKEKQNNSEKTKIINKLQSAYELEKQQQKINILQHQTLLNQKELTNIKLKRDLIAVCALSLLCLVIFLVRNYLAKKKLILKLEEQNNEIVEKNKHLEELILVRNRMFSIIGHDLRGPIHSIKGMMEMLGMEELDEEEKKFFIEKASQSLYVTANLIDNLLYWAKSQMDGMQTKPILFDIQKLIKQNIVLIEGRASDKKIRLQIDDQAQALMVFADETMIDIVLRNLIENAVKFLNAGNCITIKAQLQTEQNEVIVSVKDDGVGIASEAQSKIFNKYTSYSTYGTAKEKGSGLGLLLCKELVEKNQGRIWFESKPNEGTTFFFSIPVA